ncbi:phthiocerol/phenolphthiocerol synthesis type-I polyketide synthase C/ansamitocin polyketide synthase A/epothilone polyketide synthase D [Saccharopolyspora antimicrobica]|uniref:Phthiocerol/phenolphthiocerol synthesis type-I polyketide synthase C/ansamitocin polyketide synthase A/epothilone polyketide synthase D n=1 Tax=Saccharopolyspora antimicrobica TaxID=455193 RepID=A0A1I5GNV6_9PSEU|nr:polyketide synthase [Saccharopolyspora antimicrobica]RKT87434.1 phthiocerol/phenolphthiocerol synthesis type-I polyketide synthase C/ansamitocin polyketide synthase A/epothilone polyketide synthase D [Saccharopolyspora antimicrobica]SFO37617.1 phthiocerol/phenolphthiocerol synthesis type-I polyketide synthase C/ansamitocin polyketide synthase A/epothilone polyketide synthase D [Saccharopolyspora antimicrobica]
MPDYIDYLDTLSRKQLMLMLARQHLRETESIAVVGLGCRLPGEIDDGPQLWSALRSKTVVPTAGPPTDSLGRPRWNLDAPDLRPFADLLRRGRFLSGIDLFDAERFAISPAEAASMDPQQRVLLEVAVRALADAGLDPADLATSTVGVFAGSGPVEYPYAWLRNGTPAAELSGHMATGSAAGAVSGRVAHALGVSGPAMTVDTASSSMLSAVHLACQSLRRRECDIAVVGTCSLLLSPFSAPILADAGMLSPTGTSLPFTASADGYVRGEGASVVVLERQSDAVRAQRLPYALVRGSAMYQQGDRPGLAVASSAGQRKVIELALADARLEPADVHYVEAQANGSKIGGVIEAESLSAAYRPDGSGVPLYVGSCKANLGYLEHASGGPGLLKAVLALDRAEIPPQVGADDADPALAWDRLGLRLAAEPLPWPSDGPRRAAVSGFGFTGTMAHVVLESAATAQGTTAGQRRPELPAFAGERHWPDHNTWC